MIYSHYMIILYYFLIGSKVDRTPLAVYTGIIRMIDIWVILQEMVTRPNSGSKASFTIGAWSGATKYSCDW